MVLHAAADCEEATSCNIDGESIIFGGVNYGDILWSPLSRTWMEYQQFCCMTFFLTQHRRCGIMILPLLKSPLTM